MEHQRSSRVRSGQGDGTKAAQVSKEAEWRGQGKVGGVRVQRPGGQVLGSETSMGLGLEVEEPKGDPRGSVYGRGMERSKANSKGGRVARLGRPKTRTGSRRRNTQPPAAFGTHGAKQQLPSPLRVRRGRAPSAPRVASASPPRHLSTTATHLTPAARSGTAPPRWAGKGAGAGTQRGPASAASGLDSGNILPLYGQ